MYACLDKNFTYALNGGSRASQQFSKLKNIYTIL